MDALTFDHPHYDRKLQDLQTRQNKIYDQIASVESEIADTQIRLENIQQNKVSAVTYINFFSISINSTANFQISKRRPS